MDIESNNNKLVQDANNKGEQTLDEPVCDTIMRDLKQIGFKLRYVLVPKNMSEDKGKELRNWDLWGPLLLCLMLALTLKGSNSAEDEENTIFATIFVIIWVGAGVVALNSQLLGGKISLFQSICVLGYCIFPINISALIGVFLGNGGWMFIVKLILVILGFLWATYSSIGFFQTLVSTEKRLLAVYPVFLFYLFLSWYALIA